MLFRCFCNKNLFSCGKPDSEFANQYTGEVYNLDDADHAIIGLQTPWEPREESFIETMFHQGYLNFKVPELSRILEITQKLSAISCIYHDRPSVIPEIAKGTAGLLADFS